MQNQNRLKSKVVWTAIIAQIVLIVGLYLPDIAPQIKVIGGAVIEILTLFGVLNNPTNKSNF